MDIQGINQFKQHSTWILFPLIGVLGLLAFQLYALPLWGTVLGVYGISLITLGLWGYSRRCANRLEAIHTVISGIDTLPVPVIIGNTTHQIIFQNQICVKKLRISSLNELLSLTKLSPDPKPNAKGFQFNGLLNSLKKTIKSQIVLQEKVYPIHLTPVRSSNGQKVGIGIVIHLHNPQVPQVHANDSLEKELINFQKQFDAIKLVSKPNFVRLKDSFSEQFVHPTLKCLARKINEFNVHLQWLTKSFKKRSGTSEHQKFSTTFMRSMARRPMGPDLSQSPRQWKEVEHKQSS